jgi:hypothetical protein
MKLSSARTRLNWQLNYAVDRCSKGSCDYFMPESNLSTWKALYEFCRSLRSWMTCDVTEKVCQITNIGWLEEFTFYWGASFLDLASNCEEQAAYKLFFIISTIPISSFNNCFHSHGFSLAWRGKVWGLVAAYPTLSAFWHSLNSQLAERALWKYCILLPKHKLDVQTVHVIWCRAKTLHSKLLLWQKLWCVELFGLLH